MPIKARPPAPFVVGVPRSGTTLLRVMLDAHPDLAIPAETHFFPDLIERWRELEAAGAPDDRLREEAIALITGHPRWAELGVEEAEVAERVGVGRPTLAAALRAVGEAFAASAKKPRWGDKTPGYVVEMESIQDALPEARFVHVIRDGRDVAVSLAGLDWGPDDVAGVATMWSRRIRIARRQAAKLAPDSYLEVRYEDLVLDPAKVLGAVCTLLDLSFAQSMLSHGEAGSRMLAGVAVERRHQHATVAEPLDPGRIGRWRRKLGDAERRRFEDIAGPTLEELGYGVGA
jgi:Sulfotransferase family